MRAAAKGQIWSGADAKANGLVDALGGLSTAVDLAREAAGIAPEATVRLERFPPEADGYRALLRRIIGEELARAGITTELAAPLVRFTEILAPIARTLAPLAEEPAGRTLRMPEIRSAP